MAEVKHITDSGDAVEESCQLQKENTLLFALTALVFSQVLLFPAMEKKLSLQERVAYGTGMVQRQFHS